MRPIKDKLLGCSIALISALLVLDHGQASNIQQIPNQLAAVTALGYPTAGASTSNLTINYGGASFSQGGVIWSANSANQAGFFGNIDSSGYPFTSYLAEYDYIDGSNRIQCFNGANAPCRIQPADGFLSIGSQLPIPPVPLTVGGSAMGVWDVTSLASESLTNGALTGGTSWSATTDCALTANAATCTYSAGTASTLSQASGTLAIAGHGGRLYKFVYTISGLTGTPTATITNTFCNLASSAQLCNLDLRSTGTKTTYFQAVTVPGNFTISTTLMTGQAFTIDTLSLKEVTGGNMFVGGALTPQTYATATRCYSAASPAVCGSAAAGAAVIAAAATTVVVNTTAVTLTSGVDSQISVTEDSSIGTILGVTCNTQSLLVLGAPRVTARVNGTSFTVSVDVGPTANPLCFSYSIIN